MAEKHPSNIVSRIAPTPSGFLHKGNAFSFVLTWLLVRKMGGRLLLRIDDGDTSRSRPEFVEDIFYTLDWLGLDYDIGPAGPEDFAKNFSQQHRIGLYESFLDKLGSVEGLVFACSCSRKKIQQESINGLYPGTCRLKGLPYKKKNVAWRVFVPQQEVVQYKEWESNSLESIPLGQQMGCFVIRKKDSLPAYQLSSLADDIFYGVNFIVRGSDLCLSTAAQMYLANCFSANPGPWKSEAKVFLETDFFHHPLLLDDTGTKLSKSLGATSVHYMREAGLRPKEIYRMVATTLGLPDDSSHSLNELLEAFPAKER